MNRSGCNRPCRLFRQYIEKYPGDSKGFESPGIGVERLFLFLGCGLLCGGFLFWRGGLFFLSQRHHLLSSLLLTRHPSSVSLKVFGAVRTNLLSRLREMAMDVIGVFPL